MVNYTAILSTAGTGLTAVVILGVIGAAVALWIKNKKYNTEVIIREVRNGRTLVRKGEARIVEKDSGNKFLKVKYSKQGLFKHKDKIPVPESKSLDVTKDGKNFMEVFKTEDGDYIPITFEFDKEGFEENNPGYEPFTSGQRAMLINELKHADQYGAKKWQKVIKDNAPIFAVAIMVIGVTIFIPDIIAEYNTVINNMQGVSEGLNDVVDKVNGIAANEQVITAVQEATNNTAENATRTVQG